MTRLAIKNNENDSIVNINLDTVAYYEVGDFDKESGEICLVIFFNSDRQMRFVFGDNLSKKFLNAEIKMCVASGEYLEADRMAILRRI